MTRNDDRPDNARRQKRVLIYVQHLLGVGHVFRVKRLTAGLKAQGFAVDIVFGGPTLLDMNLGSDRLNVLPVIKAGAVDYSFNVDGHGNPLTRAYLAKRQARLLQVVETLQPDAVLVEAFPFGRRFLRHELIAMFDLLQQRKPAPLIICSVRDILHENRKPSRFAESVETLNRYFDHLIVHSDPILIRLDASFPLTGEINIPRHYSGFVVDQRQPAKQAEWFDVVVSVGGGAFGDGVMRAALAAHDLSSLKGLRWCLATGPNLPTETADFLRTNAPENITVTPFIDDLKSSLKQARVSISQAGYNTSMDVLAASQEGNCRHIFVPFDVDGQTEQLRRAKLLETAGLAICLPESELSPQALATAIDAAIKLPNKPVKIDFNGVENTAQIVAELIQHRDMGANPDG